MKSFGFWSKSDAKNGHGEERSILPPSARQWSQIPFLGQTFQFHDAAHDTVARIVEMTGSSAIRMNVIGRNIALLTSYNDVRSILNQNWPQSTTGDQPSDISRAQAYEQLMSSFYSPPNLLLEDEFEPGAREHRTAWNSIISSGMKSLSWCGRVDEQVEEWISTTLEPVSESQGRIDLYESCKELGQRLALCTFLGLSKDEEGDSFSSAQHWSEEMLRGQFSIPLSVDAGFYQNAFSRGQACKQKFDGMVQERVKQTMSTTNADSSHQATSLCPFVSSKNVASSSDPNEPSLESLVSHNSMFSSNLVVKAFASLAMALTLQLSRTEKHQSLPLSAQLNAQYRNGDVEGVHKRLESIITETERLCPPIIGVMRRVVGIQGIVLPRADSANIQVPRNWDVWPYFPMANRDKEVFGKDASQFKSDRYLDDQSSVPKPLSYGDGVKDCAGRQLVRSWLTAMALRLFIARTGTATQSTKSSVFDIQFDQTSLSIGVQDWLGWSTTSSSGPTWSSMKQLPTQRPREPIFVRISAHDSF